MVCLLGSVLLHELGHALTARRYGIGVRGITLELLGGYTEMDRDAPSPRVDLLVSLAGPAVSARARRWPRSPPPLALPDGTLADQLAFQLAVSNVIVAVFNSLPGLPLDGGRALRAAVWALTRDRHLGTEVAGWVGPGRRRRHRWPWSSLLTVRRRAAAAGAAADAAGRVHPLAGRRPVDPGWPGSAAGSR